MHVLNPSELRSVYSLDSDQDSLAISFSSSDYDDAIASQTQMQFSSSATSYNQEQFKMVAQNLQESGTVLY